MITKLQSALLEWYVDVPGPHSFEQEQFLRRLVKDGWFTLSSDMDAEALAKYLNRNLDGLGVSEHKELSNLAR